MAEPNLTGDGRTVTVRAPFSIRPRGGRKLILAPDGTTGAWAQRRVDNAMSQSDHSGVPLAPNAGRWDLRHHRGDRGS
jgi:hypothetical protein